MANLGHLTDELNEALQDAEDALEGLRLGVAASVPMGPDHALTWRKNGNEWALLVVMPGEGGMIELIRASRLLRVAAADALPALKDALFEAHARNAEEVGDATRKVRSFIASLQGNSNTKEK